jgi:hypothetical protein
MYRRLIQLTAPKLSETHISEIATMDEAPDGYRNVLRLLAADSARRRGRLDQSQALMSDCTNPQLVQVWSAWLERMHGAPARQALLSTSRGTI